MLSFQLNSTLMIAIAAAIGVVLLNFWIKRKKPKVDFSSAKWRLIGQLDKIWIYPIKSCAAIELEAAVVSDHSGLQYGSLKDRIFLIVMTNDSHTMVTSRMCPQSVLIRIALLENGDYKLSYPNTEPLILSSSILQNPGEVVTSKVWSDEVIGSDCGDAAAQWLSPILGRNVRLLLYHPHTSRQKSLQEIDFMPLLRREFDAPLFADLTSFMMLSSSSVDALQKLVPPDIQVSALQFRPNFVVRSLDNSDEQPLKAFAEDNWLYIKFGVSAVFRNVKPCTRCISTCVDPMTGKAHHEEPLKTLKRHRTRAPFPAPGFGIHLGLDEPGDIKCGDPVFVLTADDL